MKKLWIDIRSLFIGWEIIVHLAFLFTINFGLFHVLTKNTTWSIIIGFVGMVFYFLVFAYKNRKLRNYQNDLGELLKYVLNLTFFLKTGDNILNAMKSVSKTVDKSIQKEINKTIEILEKKATLDTKHFESYKFPTLDQFHHNLSIMYEHGGDIDELFRNVQHNMMYELKKRDELYRKRKMFSFNVYVLLGMVVGIALLLRFMVTDLWDIFINYGFVGIGIMIFCFVLMLINLYLLQNKNADISVRL